MGQAERDINPAKTGEPIKLPFGVVSGMGPRNCVLDGCTHWCHLSDVAE